MLRPLNNDQYALFYPKYSTGLALTSSNAAKTCPYRVPGQKVSAANDAVVVQISAQSSVASAASSESGYDSTVPPSPSAASKRGDVLPNTLSRMGDYRIGKTEFKAQQQSLNGVVVVKRAYIACRHFAASNMISGDTRANIKNFIDESHIFQFFSKLASLEEEVIKVKQAAASIYFDDVINIGQHIAREAATLGEFETKGLLIESESHTMSLELRRARQTAVTGIFYDPNFTDQYKELTLSPDSWHNILAAELSPVYDVDYTQHIFSSQQVSITVIDADCLHHNAVCLPQVIFSEEVPINAELLSLALDNTDGNVIKTLGNFLISKLGQERTIDLLTLASGYERGLISAFQNGYSESIREYRKLIKELGVAYEHMESGIGGILNTCLALATEYGRADNIKEFGLLLLDLGVDKEIASGILTKRAGRHYQLSPLQHSVIMNETSIIDPFCTMLQQAGLGQKQVLSLLNSELDIIRARRFANYAAAHHGRETADRYVAAVSQCREALYLMYFG